MVQAYKSAVTRRINALETTPAGILWQRGFYEHILRDEAELNRIREYILANPENWETDEENPLVFGIKEEQDGLTGIHSRAGQCQ